MVLITVTQLLVVIWADCEVNVLLQYANNSGNIGIL